jgi:amylosucrase
VIEYISEEECQLSYNPLLMALLWEALATRDVKLLQLSMRERFQLGPCCAWANYVRSHDDIGWTFDDADAARLGINGFDHRLFLNSFYTGRFEGSFARGLSFQENPRTGDARISGTCASLAGLEAAVYNGDPEQIELGIRRVLLLYSVALSIGGIPLIYLGDEVGTLNDYSFRDDPTKAEDSRWVHRPHTDWSKVDRRKATDTIEGQIYNRLNELIDIRKKCVAFVDGGMEVVETGNPHVFAYVRHGAAGRVLVLANFSEYEQRIPANVLRLAALGYAFKDIVSDHEVSVDDSLVLEPYRFSWLA